MSGSAISVSKATTPSSPWCTSVMRDSSRSTVRRRPTPHGIRAAVGRRTRVRASMPDPGPRRPARGVRPRAGSTSPTWRPTRSRCSAAGCDDAVDGRAARAERDGGRDGRRPTARPSARMVLLKGVSTSAGFVFYTNTGSRKGAELAGNPRVRAALPVAPPASARSASTGTADAAAAGGASRPTSPCRPARLPARRLGVAAVAGGRRRAPSSTSGVRRGGGAVRRADDVPAARRSGAASVVRPEVVEFWQGRPGRMHDRLRLPPRDGDRHAPGPWSGSRRWRLRAVPSPTTGGSA